MPGVKPEHESGFSEFPEYIPLVPAVYNQIPESRQFSNFDCGDSVAQVMAYLYGYPVREDVLLDLLGTSKHESSGTDWREIEKFLTEHCKLNVKTGIEISLDELRQLLDNDCRVIVLLQAWGADDSVDLTATYDEGHYAVAIGYGNDETIGDYIIFEDPSTLGNLTFIQADYFDKRWHHEENDGEKVNHFGLWVESGEVKYQNGHDQAPSVYVEMK